MCTVTLESSLLLLIDYYTYYKTTLVLNLKLNVIVCENMNVVLGACKYAKLHAGSSRKQQRMMLSRLPAVSWLWSLLKSVFGLLSRLWCRRLKSSGVDACSREDEDDVEPIIITITGENETKMDSMQHNMTKLTRVGSLSGYVTKDGTGNNFSSKFFIFLRIKCSYLLSRITSTTLLLVYLANYSRIHWVWVCFDDASNNIPIVRTNSLGKGLIWTKQSNSNYSIG